ncbi:MAG: sulfite exporter TauE/SafE family protein [candidate division Zixibacteria bacterium]
MIEFPISGVETYFWLPALVAFLVTSITSTAGVGGGFIFLPFQVSILGFTTPGVSATNLLINVLTIPSGAARYHAEKRLLWPLALLMIIFALPGVILGAYMRVTFLPDPTNFKLFVGIVLLILSVRLVGDMFRSRRNKEAGKAIQSFRIESAEFGFRELRFDFNGEQYRLSTLKPAILSLVVGVIGGLYGIGGGVILAPYLVTAYSLPVFAVAGAVLVTTFATSVGGVLAYLIIANIDPSGSAAMPDFWLGLSFGVGGAAGMYLGARLQRFFPAKLIKGILFVTIVAIALKYIYGFFA